ncbi:LOW QUALITY PROTEIN: uncharacterized protein LOC110821638 [Carica papaya]|uniref:LOW QUALITY PROTEIN: uncharacterized protein LOC110821638 n=1 Tax=Carica papaya TaxID=3649 RepID=UPI000B8C917F|nr:LOW QUALITY PROTEIN: uncharacterized protein LOC110821638 [Carica papaya]
MDKPHHDGSSLSRSQSDVARMFSPFGDQIEDKLIVSELRRTASSNKPNGTPMKKLIAQEMSKEMDFKHSPPNLVAKLMGLDTLPLQQPNSAAHRSSLKGYSRCSLSHSGMSAEYWEQDNSIMDKQMQTEAYKCQEHNTYKDVYEIWQHSAKTNYARDNSPRKGRYTENINEKRMAFVRQKFIEAKRLSTDEKLRKSKEFQDALEVLSSNRDLLLKILQEPNSMFSQHMYELQSIPPPPETKRITVLRPSKVVDNEKFAVRGKKSDKQAKKPVQVVPTTGWDGNNPGCSPPLPNQRVEEFPTQPTRIVVLKPSPAKTHDIKTVVPTSPSSSAVLPVEGYYEEQEDDEARESREVAKEITRQMRENLMGHERDETLISSVFSNGYIGDDSSCNKSENEYEAGNLSDSEVMSPTSRHSWGYVNRFDSPYSSCSFSHASCSPESSVCREAKKRLSERWALMTSNGNFQEQKHVRRSSSTLGEMLALSDIKRPVRLEEEISNKEQETKRSTSCSTSNMIKEEDVNDSPKNLLRSKSVPVSSTVYGARLNVEISDHESGKILVPEELTKAKNTKSSFKGKVSSLFFSRNKKSNKEKSTASESRDETQLKAPGSPVTCAAKTGDYATQCANSGGLEECLSPGLHGSSSKMSSPDLIGTGWKQNIVSREAGLLTKPVLSGNASENHDQPSPISVLEVSFEEDDNTVPESSGNTKPDLGVMELPLRSNLIDKSPPIESVARTLSWDDSRMEIATPYSMKPSSASKDADEEQDWLLFVKKLLSAAGLDGEINFDSFLTRWHSTRSPLDPSLIDRYASLNEKVALHGAKRRQWRSNQKLAFDCVNAALAALTGYQADRSTRSLSCSGTQTRLADNTLPALVEHVWAQMKDWFSGELKYGLGDSGDRNSLVVDSVVRKEVVGKGWAESLEIETDNLGKEIEGKLLEELLEEAVVDLTSRV